MLISRDQALAGMPAPIARAIAREFVDGRPIASAARSLEMDEATLRSHVDAMQAEDLLTSETIGQATFWRTTVAGNALAKARIGKPMTRQKAESIVDELLDRVRSANADPEGLFWIEWVELFGSFTDPAAVSIGDLDVRIMASSRYEDAEFDRRRNELVEASGRSFTRYLDLLAFPNEALRKRLVNRNPRIDLQLDFGKIRALPPAAKPLMIYRRETEPPSR